MEEGLRRWEDMQMCCLANIFGRLGMEDMTLAVPFVCRSWLRASLDPLCWRVLNFRDLDFMPWSDFTKTFTAKYSVERFSFSGLLRLAVARSNGLAVELQFPLVFGASLQDLLYSSNECTRLQKVALPNLLSADEPHVPQLVGKWKELEQLQMESKPSSFSEMVAQISAHCKNFAGLRFYGSIKEEDVSAIGGLLPKLKHLCLSKSYLPREQLLGIMDACSEMESLIVKDCIGFEADEALLKRASKIKSFEHEGSKLVDESGYETDDCDPLYVHAI